MAKQGFFKSTNKLVTTSVDSTEEVLYQGLTTISNTSKIIGNLGQEFLNDSLEDLIDSRVRLSKKLKQAEATLEEDGYEPEEIEAILNFQRK